MGVRAGVGGGGGEEDDLIRLYRFFNFSLPVSTSFSFNDLEQLSRISCGSLLW